MPKIISKTKDDLQVILLESCLMGHPVPTGTASLTTFQVTKS